MRTTTTMGLKTYERGCGRRMVCICGQKFYDHGRIDELSCPWCGRSFYRDLTPGEEFPEPRARQAKGKTQRTNTARAPRLSKAEKAWVEAADTLIGRLVAKGMSVQEACDLVGAYKKA